MNDTGLLALNGIPGSGKTLHSVLIALKYYKKENAFYKYYLSCVKYHIRKFIDSNKVLTKILDFYKKISEKTLYKILIKGLYYFFNLFIFLFLFVDCSFYFKCFVVVYLLYHQKFFKSLNTVDFDYYNLFPHKKINNIYSNFPILLDKKRNIWTNKITLFDLENKVSFLPNSLIIIDETQLSIDSEDYKDKILSKFIGRIAKYLQSHRHFGIKQIIFTSQSPSRIFKKARNIVVGYLKQAKLVHLPFEITIMRGVMYYDFEFYGRYIPLDREERKKLPFDYKKVVKVFRRNNVYSAYDSRYLALYNYEKPLLSHGTWDDFKVPYEMLEDMFEERVLDSHLSSKSDKKAR